MKVTLRQREKSGKISLYLDYYHKGKRKYEYLRLYLDPKPKTPLDRESNRKTLQLAEKLRAKRYLELQNGVYGFNDSDRMNGSFLTYFEVMVEKRKESEGNYGNWNSALKYLQRFRKGNVKFADIDNQWLEDLKYYLVHEARTIHNKPLSKNTCVSYYNKVRASLRQAVKDGIMPNNPAQQVDGIKEVETMREFLTLEEVQKIYTTKCEIPVLKRAFIFS